MTALCFTLLITLAAAQTCTNLPPHTCFQNPKGKMKGVTIKGDDPLNECCAACGKEDGCKSWCFSGSKNCNLYNDIGPSKKVDEGDKCQGGLYYAPGQPTPPPTPPPPPSPKPKPKPPSPGPTPPPTHYRNTTGLPNIVFIVVESTDGRTWSKNYSNNAIPLPNIRELQNGGLEFHRHYSNAPVCCPSRATFWSGRHASNIPHDHNGVTVNGAWNNYEGLPGNYSDRIDQVMTRVGGYNVLVTGKTDWSTGGHSETVRLNAWTMYTQFPYNINASGGWGDEGGTCASSGSVKKGGGMKTGSAHAGDWQTADKTTKWIGSVDKSLPFFVYSGMNIVHPPYNTNEYWYNKIDPAKIDVPDWTPLEQLHPCDLQSSMLKGCTPSDDDSEAFYSVSRRRNLRRIYAAMVAEFDAMVGQYMQAVKDAGVWDNTVFIVTSDHGDMQMERQQHYKMVPYDASASVPMVMYDGRQQHRMTSRLSRLHGGNGKVIESTSQLIDIFPTIMELANVSKSDYPADLDGKSLMPLFGNGDYSEMTPAEEEKSLQESGDRPVFVVSQFHGDNVAMSWFLVVQNLPSGSTFKLIVWGTGKEVPSMLFNLTADPGEQRNLINSPDHATIIATLDGNLRSVVDYEKVALNVAQYGKDMFAQWINTTSNWEEAIHGKGIRWDASWMEDPEDSIAAVKAWMAEPAEVLPCRGELKWPASKPV